MIEILFENNDITVCVKPVGIASQNDGTEDMCRILSRQLETQIYPVHRLDTAVGGTMVFAKNKKAAAELSELIAGGGLEKRYLAVVSGIPEKNQDTLKDFLYKDRFKNKTFVVNRERKGVKKASLEYKVLGTYNNTAFLRIKLHTGRSHQIRVQLASRRHPLLGDGKYGSKDNKCSIALWSEQLCFDFDGKRQSFVSLPDFQQYPWANFRKFI